MSKFFYAEIWPNPDIDFDKKEYTQSKIILLNEKKKTYFDQKRSIKAKIKTFSQQLGALWLRWHSSRTRTTQCSRHPP